MLDIYRATAAPQVFAVHSHPVRKTCVVSTHHKKTMARVLEDCQSAFELSLAGTMLTDIVGPMRRGV